MSALFAAWLTLTVLGFAVAIAKFGIAVGVFVVACFLVGAIVSGYLLFAAARAGIRALIEWGTA